MLNTIKDRLEKREKELEEIAWFIHTHSISQTYRSYFHAYGRAIELENEIHFLKELINLYNSQEYQRLILYGMIMN